MRTPGRTALSLAACGLLFVALSGSAQAWSKWRAVRGGSVTQVIGTRAAGTRSFPQAGTPPRQSVASKASITGQQKVGDTMRVTFVDAGGVRRQFSGTVAKIERKKNGATLPKNKSVTTRFEIRSGQVLTAGSGNGTYLDVQVTRGGRDDGKVSVFATRRPTGVRGFTDFDGIAIP